MHQTVAKIRMFERQAMRLLGRAQSGREEREADPKKADCERAAQGEETCEDSRRWEEVKTSLNAKGTVELKREARQAGLVTSLDP